MAASCAADAVWCRARAGPAWRRSAAPTRCSTAASPSQCIADIADLFYPRYSRPDISPEEDHPMRIAVAGATGNIGSLTVAALEREGHDVVRISRSLGVDLTTGEGLDAALAGVEAVVDATNAPPLDEAETVAHFGRTTSNLLAAGARAGVRHHVLLSIVGIDRVDGQRRTTPASGSRSAWSPPDRFRGRSCRSPSSTTSPRWWPSWAEPDGVATIAPLLVQPIAPADVAEVLAEVAVGEPQGRYADVAGPDTAGPGRHGPPHVRRPRSHGQARAHLVGGSVRRGDGRYRCCCPERAPGSRRPRSTTGWLRRRRRGSAGAVAGGDRVGAGPARRGALAPPGRRSARSRCRGR